MAVWYGTIPNMDTNGKPYHDDDDPDPESNGFANLVANPPFDGDRVTVHIYAITANGDRYRVYPRIYSCPFYGSGKRTPLIRRSIR